MPIVLPGGESTFDAPGRKFERHHHLGAYAALVIRGSCEEAGDRGRFRSSAGDVLVHRAFDAHADVIGQRGAQFLNFPLAEPLGGCFGRVADPDSILRIYLGDPHEAAAMLQEQFRPSEVAVRDWPDLLAKLLGGIARMSLAEWADRHGLHPTSISRGFRQAYGVSPKRFRLERIASRAARRIAATGDTFGAIAAECDFADQAHMTRTLVQLFGLTPRTLRRLS